MAMVEAGFATPPEVITRMTQDTDQETLLTQLHDTKPGRHWWTKLNPFKRHEVVSPVEETTIAHADLVKHPRTQTEIFAEMDKAAEQDNSHYGKLTVGLAERTVNGDGIASNDKVLGALEEQRRMDQALEAHRKKLEQKSKEKKELAGVRAELAKQHPGK